jgi:anti-sigma regulatory factor (Ser/Thr protein kinase)
MDNTIDVKSLQLVNDISQLTDVAYFVDNLVDEWQLPVTFALSLNLVLEEVLTNIIFYSYGDEKKHFIDVKIERLSGQLQITICDDGREYDPTQKNVPDITVPIEERSVGGLGILLIKKIMDHVEYRRTDNRNFLFLTKAIKS